MKDLWCKLFHRRFTLPVPGQFSVQYHMAMRMVQCKRCGTVYWIGTGETPDETLRRISRLAGLEDLRTAAQEEEYAGLRKIVLDLIRAPLLEKRHGR